MVPMDNSSSNFEELDIGNSAESFRKFLESQRELFHGQVVQLQNIVITQCKLTGVNPLSQEMAAGALSIKIGKRPRDLLNPKAVKYMQSVFSIKDAISKKESREISALCGVTVTQVRDFFASQRSRVRKIMRLSREKAIRSSECKESQEGSSISDPAIPINQVPLNSMGPNTVEEAPSCSVQEETFPGVDDSDKTFLHNIFNLMRTEETFSGQVKLMEWILKIQNSSVLNWFLTKGGVMILATWLSQAALEEQTTVLLVIFKVLCHLPLHKALPAQMSAILQIVNRLRFYRTSDISNRARVLLSRWSKIFVRSQAMKKPCSMKLPGDTQKEIIQTQRDGEILSNESWPSETNIPVSATWEEILSLTNGGSESWKTESTQPLKLLPSSTDYLNKKNVRSVSSSQTRERRKVLLVEQPGQKTINRSLQVGKAVPVKQGRPLSADDIQKAKMRAMFMQDKYGKTGSSSDKSCEQKTEYTNKFSASQTIYPLPKPKALVSPKTLEETKPTEIASKTVILPEAPPNRKSLDPLEHLSLEKLKRDQIPWQTPPEIRINSLWRVGTGEKSKEVEIQTGRNRRDKETIYQSTQHIPLDPKEPWDVEMDYDDSLTPEIPIEQPPDADGAEAPSSPRDNEPTTLDASITIPAKINTGNAPEPDLELLAVLLKNPELVFALTSGQNGSLTTADTVKLLDMIKASKISSPEILDGFGGKSQQKVEVTSLPSPTPSTDPLMRGWGSEGTKDSVLQQCTAAARSVTGFPVVNSTTLLQDNLRATNMVQHQVQATNLVSPQGSGIVAPSHQQPPAVMHPQSAPQPVVLPEKQPSTIIRAQQHPLPQAAVPEAVLPVKHFPAPTLQIQNPLQWVKTSSFGQDMVKPAPVSIMLNQPNERHSITLPSLPTLLPTTLRPESPLIPEAPPSVKPLYSSWPQNSADFGSQTLVLDSRGNRQGSASYAFTQANQNGYNLFTGGPGQPQQPLLPGGPWGRREVVDEPELEMWSPERSPVRSPENRYGQHFQEFRRDYGRSSSRPDWSRDRSSGYRDHNKHGSRRWRDRRR